jgi:ferredoxin/flavodoxin---NADP+ reductase
VSPSVHPKYTEETVTWIKSWVPGKLFSFRTTRFSGMRFTPGQFLRLGIEKKTSHEDNNSNNSQEQKQLVWRAYSVVSANYEDHLEFYSIIVPNGEFTSELVKLQLGDSIFIEKEPYGFLTTARFQGGRDLWLLSTGTGLAPFLSILWDPEVWNLYDHIVVVHCVREIDELTYQDTLQSYQHNELIMDTCKFHPNKLTYIPIVTRQNMIGALNNRIPTLIDNGFLEKQANLTFHLDHSRFMICGNPEMVNDTRKSLSSLGFKTSRRSQPGHIAVENYW